METYCRIRAIYEKSTEKDRADKNKLKNLVNIGKLENYRGKEGKIIYLVSKGETEAALQTSHGLSRNRRDDYLHHDPSQCCGGDCQVGAG